MKGPKLIYFMRPIGMKGPVKVGCSVIPVGRLKSLDIWSPFPLEIIATVPGEHNHERALHWHLKEHRLHGEWFSPNSKLDALLTHIGRLGTLPPLEAAPYGKTKMGRGRNPNRNPDWSNTKAQITLSVWRAERHAYGWSGNGLRPTRIVELIKSYHGPFTPPPSEEVRAEIAEYVSALRAKPKDKRDWRTRQDERMTALGIKAKAA